MIVDNAQLAYDTAKSEPDHSIVRRFDKNREGDRCVSVNCPRMDEEWHPIMEDGPDT